jgi:hypothetical protein
MGIKAESGLSSVFPLSNRESGKKVIHFRKLNWGRTTVKAWQFRICAKNSPVFLAYSDVFGTKKGGLRKK